MHNFYDNGNSQGQIDVFIGDFKASIGFFLEKKVWVVKLYDQVKGWRTYPLASVNSFHMKADGRSNINRGSALAAGAIAGLFGFGVIMDENTFRQVDRINCFGIVFCFKNGKRDCVYLIPRSYDYYSESDVDVEIKDDMIQACRFVQNYGIRNDEHHETIER